MNERIITRTTGLIQSTTFIPMLKDLDVCPEDSNIRFIERVISSAAGEMVAEQSRLNGESLFAFEDIELVTQDQYLKILLTIG